MQRRMMKALEDLSVAYDGTVRTAESDIVQFVYGVLVYLNNNTYIVVSFLLGAGQDGLDPAYMEANGRPVDLARALLNAQVRLCNSD